MPPHSIEVASLRLIGLRMRSEPGKDESLSFDVKTRFWISSTTWTRGPTGYGLYKALEATRIWKGSRI